MIEVQDIDPKNWVYIQELDWKISGTLSNAHSIATSLKLKNVTSLSGRTSRFLLQLYATSVFISVYIGNCCYCLFYGASHFVSAESRFYFCGVTWLKTFCDAKVCIEVSYVILAVVFFFGFHHRWKISAKPDHGLAKLGWVKCELDKQQEKMTIEINKRIYFKFITNRDNNHNWRSIILYILRDFPV